jgi:hypothetical protein
LRMPRLHRFARTGFSLRSVSAATRSSRWMSRRRVAPPSSQRRGRAQGIEKGSGRAVCRRLSTCSGGRRLPRSCATRRRCPACTCRRVPSLLVRPSTPRAFRQRVTVLFTTPHQYIRADALSPRIAWANSSSTSRPEPPRWPSARQRGQELAAK